MTVLEPSGRLTLQTGGDALDEKLQGLIAAGHRAVLLDCTNILGIDSWGIRTLVRGVTEIEKQGGKLKLLKLPPQMRQALKFTRVLTLIETYDEELLALASFAATQPPAGEILPPGAERRRTPRISLLTQVEVLGPGAGGVGRIQDISLGGLLMASPETFPPRTEVAVRFNLPPIPPGRPVEGQGIVAHAEPGVKMGIQFLLLKDDDRKAIAEFIETACA